MNKIVLKAALTVLAMALLGAASAALAGEGSEVNYYDGPYNPGRYSDFPVVAYHYPAVHYQAVYYHPQDMRLRAAEAEKLKTSYHYYALSCRPYDAETAAWMAGELYRVQAELNSWYYNR